MTNLKHIENDVALQMSLSRLLNAELKIVECWHTRGESTAKHPNNDYWCVKCAKHLEDLDRDYNPNLFTKSAFLDVWDAVYKREDYYFFMDRHRPPNCGDVMFTGMIVSPRFQLEVLKWLLEKDGRGEELERVMK